MLQPSQGFQLPPDFDPSQMAVPQNTVAVGPSYDYADLMRKQKKLEREGAIAQALFQKGQQPQEGQMVGGYYVGPGLAGGLANLASTLGGAYLLNKSGDKEADLLREASQGRSAILQALMKNDPNASQMAIASGDPELIKLVQDSRLSPKDLLAQGDKLTPTSLQKVAQTGNIADVEYAPDLQAVEGQLVDMRTAQPGQDFRDQPIGRTTLNGDLYTVYRRRDGSTYEKKLDNAPTTNVNMPRGESQFEKDLGSAEAKRFSERMAMREGQIEGVNATNEGLALLDQGIYSGFAATAVKDLDKIAGKLGGYEPEKAARTEQFISYIGDIVLPGLKAFGGSDTVEEMKYLQKIVGGDISLDVNALRGILGSVQRKLSNRIKLTDSMLKEVRPEFQLPTFNEPELSPLPQGYQSPEQPAAQPQPLTLEALREFRRTQGR